MEERHYALAVVFSAQAAAQAAALAVVSGTSGGAIDFYWDSDYYFCISQLLLFI